MRNPNILTFLGFGLSRFTRDARGNMLMVTSVATLAIIAATSTAIDFSRKSSVEAQLQKIADTAVHAAASPANLPKDAKDAELRRIEIATNYLVNSRSDIADAKFVGNPQVTVSPNSIEVTLNAFFESSWAGVFSFMSDDSSVNPNLTVTAMAKW